EFKEKTALFRFNRVRPWKSVDLERHYGINRLLMCCVDRLSRHAKSEAWILVPTSSSGALLSSVQRRKRNVRPGPEISVSASSSNTNQDHKQTLFRRLLALRKN